MKLYKSQKQKYENEMKNIKMSLECSLTFVGPGNSFAIPMKN